MGYRSTNTIFITAAPLETGPQAPEDGAAAVGFASRATPKKVKALTGRCIVGFGMRSGVDAAAVGLGFTHVTVTRDYDLADGTAPAGVVYFTPSDWLVNNRVTIAPAPVAAELDVDGRVTISLVTNTASGTTPTGSYYAVREVIVGQPQRSYRITIPSDVAGFTVDLGYLEDPVVDSGYGLGGYGTSGYGA